MVRSTQFFGLAGLAVLTLVGFGVLKSGALRGQAVGSEPAAVSLVTSDAELRELAIEHGRSLGNRMSRHVTSVGGKAVKGWLQSLKSQRTAARKGEALKLLPFRSRDFDQLVVVTEPLYSAADETEAGALDLHILDGLQVESRQKRKHPPTGDEVCRAPCVAELKIQGPLNVIRAMADPSPGLEGLIDAVKQYRSCARDCPDPLRSARPKPKRPKTLMKPKKLEVVYPSSPEALEDFMEEL